MSGAAHSSRRALEPLLRRTLWLVLATLMLLIACQELAFHVGSDDPWAGLLLGRWQALLPLAALLALRVLVLLVLPVALAWGLWVWSQRLWRAWRGAGRDSATPPN